MRPTRRQTLQGLAAATGLLGLPGLSFARAATEQRFVLLVLRGAMDGLSALMPAGDPDFTAQRGPLAQPQGGEPAKLDGFFALHPALAPLLPHWQAGALLPIHALASSHRGRSHFEAQDVLEAGLTQPHSGSTGWLNRLAAALPGGAEQRLGLALGPTVPFALRGPARVASAQGSVAPGAPDAFLEKMALLWNDDAVLGPALSRETGMKPTMASMGSGRGAGAQRASDVALAKLAAQRLLEPEGPRIAVLEQNGWDTHSAQGNRFNNQAAGLAAMLDALSQGLKPVWDRTAILAVSEFGRTVQPNGTGGTDHGTAGAAFLLGGKVKGGRVLADWPGLKRGNQHEGRDLKPTLDLASVYKGIAAGHFGLDNAAALDAICPDAAQVKPVTMFG